jgi:hypothetical protein
MSEKKEEAPREREPAVMEKLAERFLDEQLRTRTVVWSDGKVKEIRYVPGGRVVGRLNEVLGLDWEFKILDSKLEHCFVKVFGELSVRAGGRTTVRQALGSAKVRFVSGTPTYYDDAEAAAVTLCLKHCAKLFGVGLHLYFDEEEAGALDIANGEAERAKKGLPPEGGIDYGQGGDPAGKPTDQQCKALARRMDTLPDKRARDAAFDAAKPQGLNYETMAYLLSDDEFWKSHGAK